MNGDFYIDAYGLLGILSYIAAVTGFAWIVGPTHLLGTGNGLLTILTGPLFAALVSSFVYWAGRRNVTAANLSLAIILVISALALFHVKRYEPYIRPVLEAQTPRDVPVPRENPGSTRPRRSEHTAQLP